MTRFENIKDMPPPMTYRNINRANNELHNAYQKATVSSMTKSVMEGRQSLLKPNENVSNLFDCSVSVDGTF